MAQDRLTGVRAKIERANYNIRDFESRVKAFRKTNPYKVVTEDDAQTGETVYKIKVRSPLPIVLAVIAGEVVYHLRSSLDHLAWQLVEASGGTPTTKTGFPIYETAAEYEKRDRRKVEGMSVRAKHRINATKPYMGGTDDLWVLHKLNNIDKHQLLFVVTYGAGKDLLTLRPAKTSKPDPSIQVQAFPVSIQIGGPFDPINT